MSTVLYVRAMRRTLVQILLVIGSTFVWPAVVWSADIYITQTASDSDSGAGTSCASARSVDWFNTNATGGNTYHLCGTLTGAAGSTILTPPSGSAGAMLTILFEAGAVLQAPYWGSAASGAITLIGKQYVTIDGASHGVIQNTENGTLLANHQSSQGIYVRNSNHIEIRNLAIQNIYANGGSDPSATDTAGATSADIYLVGNNDHIAIHDNTLSSARSGVRVDFDGSVIDSIDVYNNTIRDHCWGIVMGAGAGKPTSTNIAIHDNDISGWLNWQCPASAAYCTNKTDAYHSDGIILFTVQGSILAPLIYNNFIHGDLGQSSATAYIYCTVANPGAPGNTSTACIIFNNLLVHEANRSTWMIGTGRGTGNHQIYNNTLIGWSGNTNGLMAISGTGTKIQNNIGENAGFLYLSYEVDPKATVAVSDYNLWYNINGGGTRLGWNAGGNPTFYNLTQWKGMGFDLHSQTTAPQLNSSYRISSVLSAAFRHGTNLTSTGIAGLNLDKTGIPRPPVVAWDIGAYQFVVSRVYKIPQNGGVSLVTTEPTNETELSIAHVLTQQDQGTLAGVAIIDLKQNGVLITEAGVPASPEVVSGRVYAEVRGPVNTGIALSNPTDQDTSISFYFTNTDGRDFGSGSFTLAANQQVSAFLNQAPFNGPDNLQGSLTFNSSIPIGVIALRGLTNERGDFLLTTVPVAPLGSVHGPLILPHFADGAGWTTQVILTNCSDAPQSGTVQFFGQGSELQSAPLLNVTVNGISGSTFSYSIPPHAAAALVTAGTGTAVRAGSVWITPQGDSSTEGLAIFSFRNGDGIVVTEASVSVLPVGSAFRMYAESSGPVQSGFAIANPSLNPVMASIELTNLDGTSMDLAPDTINVPPGGQIAKFINELFPNLAAGFQGIAKVSADSMIAVTALRERYNERGDFLITTTPPLNDTVTSAAEMTFPMIVSGQGYSTQLIVFGQAGSGSLYLFCQDGTLQDGSSLTATN